MSIDGTVCLGMRQGICYDELRSKNFREQAMTITINLPPATEEQLRAQAEATGKNISTLVVEAVEARLALARLRFKDILAPVHAEFRRSGMSEADLNALLEESLQKARAERRSHPGSAA